MNETTHSCVSFYLNGLNCWAVWGSRGTAVNVSFVAMAAPKCGIIFWIAVIKGLCKTINHSVYQTDCFMYIYNDTSDCRYFCFHCSVLCFVLKKKDFSVRHFLSCVWHLWSVFLCAAGLLCFSPQTTCHAPNCQRASVLADAAFVPHFKPASLCPHVPHMSKHVNMSAFQMLAENLEKVSSDVSVQPAVH